MIKSLIRMLGGVPREELDAIVNEQVQAYSRQFIVTRQFLSEYRKQLAFLHGERIKARTPTERLVARANFEQYLEKNIGKMFSDFRKKYQLENPEDDKH